MRELLNGIFLFEWLAVNGIIYLSYKKGLSEGIVKWLFAIFNTLTITCVLVDEELAVYWFIFVFVAFVVLIIWEE
jgi:hypothetical protein